MPSKSWRVGVTGLGWVAEKVHLPYLEASPNITLAGVCDIDPERAQRVSRTYGVPAYEHLEQLVSSAVDVLCVCTPPSNHVSATLEALHSGVHVICEKPLAVTAHDAHHMAETAIAQELGLFCCLTARYREDAMTMRQEVLGGAIGEPRYLRASWLRSRGIPASLGALEHGVLWDLGSHLVDLAMWLTSWTSPTVASVTELCLSPDRSLDTAAWHSRHQRVDPDPGTADTVVLDMRFGSNAAAHIEASWSAHTAQDRTEILLIGTCSALRLRSVFGWTPARMTVPGPALVVADRAGRWRPVVGHQDRAHAEYRAQFDDFFAALNSGQLRREELRVAVNTSETLDAATQLLGPPNNRCVTNQPNKVMMKDEHSQEN